MFRIISRVFLSEQEAVKYASKHGDEAPQVRQDSGHYVAEFCRRKSREDVLEAYMLLRGKGLDVYIQVEK